MTSGRPAYCVNYRYACCWQKRAVTRRSRRRLSVGREVSTLDLNTILEAVARGADNCSGRCRFVGLWDVEKERLDLTTRTVMQFATCGGSSHANGRSHEIAAVGRAGLIEAGERKVHGDRCDLRLAVDGACFVTAFPRTAGTACTGWGTCASARHSVSPMVTSR